MLNIAFKEWAVICKALADCRQTIILRKGGIADEGGLFKPEHDRFWLYPTYVHQQTAGIKPQALPQLQQVEADRPPVGIVRIQHFVEVTAVRFLDTLETALAIGPSHIWSEETIRQRFHYRKPGLFELTVKVTAIPMAIDIQETPEYAGCKTWVTLEKVISTENS